MCVCGGGGRGGEEIRAHTDTDTHTHTHTHTHKHVLRGKGINSKNGRKAPAHNTGTTAVQIVGGAVTSNPHRE